MKRLIPLIVLTLGLALQSRAQESENLKAISIGAELGLPSRNAFSVGYGASAKFELPFNDHLGMSLTGGYSRFVYKGSIFAGQPKRDPAGFVPLKAGVLYYGSPDFFLEGELGAVVEQDEVNGVKQTLFAFAVGPSFMIPINDNKQQRLNVGLRYESWSAHTVQQIAIRVAYRLGW